MKYLIPAWYNEGNWWRDKAVPFYETHLTTEFDDMISLGNMFEKHEESFELICLNYHSQLRNFLYRNGLFEASYWSVFDAIQGFEQATPQPIDYRDLYWPEGTEFIYTPYIVKAYTGTHTSSNIYMSQEGYMTWVEDYRDEKIEKRYVFDDRGFLSSVTFFNENKQPEKIAYLKREGKTVIEEYLETGEVEVSEAFRHHFKQSEYISMKEVIQEYLATNIEKHQSSQNAYIAASDSRHNALLTEVIEGKQLTFSLFSRRQPELSHSDLNTISAARHWLIDSQAQENKLKQYKEEANLTVDMMHHTPFPAQILPNLSSQLHETEIGLMIDGLSLEAVNEQLDVLIPYVQQGEDLRLVLLTRHSRSQRAEALKGRIDEVNEQFAKAQPGYLLMDEAQIAELKLVRFEFIPFEADIVKLISTLRIMIDLNTEPDLFLQISSISAGIPQINRYHTEYMKDRANGLLVTADSELPQALDTFLIGLKNWNFAFAYSVQLVEAYSSEKLVKQLNRFIEGETYGT
ncbi:accessory Sec system protein Asp1 [Staphylococcus carnosus]|uniref:Accessory Sec system protein Asp1 n=1 Tax=Staphylococcus carnosus (strain TM300) TaxID=396513 RepID=B9DJQ5_STACT|nr:accessory Sec system protein Asp1 [Staphylococcus carnosus]QPT02876.1 accessory Sec system protein Asp1 [Staphylococcus carnosus]UQA67880.1 accessory Sec system protein Asp1 [Staphylococcus carnosus]UTB77298.1 accessory Sec system protein Asp1 [Staphylococcus carnosus]UTB86842.1 accessory Sec system protein Asp1 [Staphylococcus carnosus]UTB89192.1 accessory Sec system protein Asp1 [Staphylococcus carnosus]